MRRRRDSAARSDSELLAQLGAVSRSVRFQTMGLLVDGHRFDLRLYPYLVDLFDSNHADIVIRKGAQLGFTIALVLRVIALASALYKRSVIYFMPTRDDVSDFSKARFDRLLKENAVLARDVRGTDATHIKRIGETFVYFRGAKSRSQAKSVPADLVVFDERDEMDQDLVDLARTRLDGSPWRHQVSLSTATLPDYGVDHDYQASDQRTWHIKCRACGKWTCMELDWPESVKRRADGTAYRACKKCSGEIHTLHGDWVAAYPDRSKMGLWVSQLCSPTVSPQLVLDEYEDPGHNVREFYNSRLGLAWADTEDILDEASLRAVTTDEPSKRSAQGPCFLGADVGKREIHWWAGEKRDGELEMLAFGVVGDFGELSDILRRFNVAVAVLDEMAETRKVREYKALHGEVWGCWYSDAQRTGYDWGVKERRVAVNRTELLDQSHRMIVQKLVKMPRPDDRWHDLVKHMTNLARLVERNKETGLPKIRWVVRGGRKLDHWRHAFAYAVLAAEMAPIAERARLIQSPRRTRPTALSWMSA